MRSPCSRNLIVCLFAPLTIVLARPAHAGALARCDDYGLRTAIAEGGVVTFSCDGTIKLTNTIIISQNVVLDGTGRKVTISGAGAFQIFSVNGVDFAMTNLVIANGLAKGSSALGGAINNGGATTLVACTFTNNRAVATSFVAFGGAILNAGSLIATGCTFVSNSVKSSVGAALGGAIASGYIVNSGPVSVTNCTFYGNGAQSGSAIINLGGEGHAGPTTGVNCTFAHNRGLAVKGPSSSSFAAGVPVTLINSILLDNSGGNAANVTDGGNNLSSDNSAGFTSPLSLNNISAKLGPLAHNGGPTVTMALLASSPGIDAANDDAAPPTDQRGVGRPFGLHSDIGAYEAQFAGTFAGALQLASTNFAISETASNLTVEVYRAGGAAGAASVKFSAADGTAKSGQNYLRTNGTLSFASNQQSNQIVIPILHDPAVQGNLTFTLALSNALGAQLRGSNATVTVLDADTGVSFSTNNYSVNITGGNATVTLLRSGNTNNPVSVNFATSDGTGLAGRDYTATAGTASFAPGQLTATFNVPIVGSSSPGSNKTVNLLLSNPTNATVLSPTAAILTIVNNNPVLPGVVSFLNANFGASDAASDAVLTVTRTGGADGSVSVNYSTADGTAIAGHDYTATAGTLTFSDQQTIASIAVPLRLQNTNSGQKAFTIGLSNPTGGATLGNFTNATLVMAYGAQSLTNANDAGFRSAVQSGGNITFASDANITLSSTVTIPFGVVIDGSGHNVTINGGGAVQIFRINPGITLALRNLTLSNGNVTGQAGGAGQAGGSAQGGAIYNNAGLLEASNCIFTGNQAIGGAGGPAPFLPPVPGGGGIGQGGAIFSFNGQVFATNCTFVSNTCAGGQGGSAMAYSLGGDGNGGAICAEGGLVLLSSCTLTTNIAAGGSDSGDGAGGAAGAYGGAIFGHGAAIILNGGLVANNSAEGPGIGSAWGGAIYENTGTLAITSCLLSNNTAVGGGTWGEFYDGGIGSGGCLCIASQPAGLTNSTLVGNSAIGGPNNAAYGGAIFNVGALLAVNCTLVTNVAMAGVAYAESPFHLPGAVDSASGGAIYNAENGFAVLTQLTIASNAAAPSQRVDSTSSGGGVASTNVGAVTLENTILAFNGPGSNYFGFVVDPGNNLSSDSSAPFTNSGSRIDINPLLGPLANNGGPTPTMALLPGSPAIGAANMAFQPLTDQRGFPRPSGAAGDIGAFEVMPASNLMPGPATNNVYAISFAGPPNQPVQIQLTTNLTIWSLYLTNVTGSNGLLQFLHTNDPTQPGVFYRVLVQ